LLESEDDPLPNYYFYDLNGKISQGFGDADKLFLSGFTGKDRLEVSNNAGYAGDMEIENRCGSLRWTHLFSGSTFSTVNVSWSKYVTGFISGMSGWENRMRNGIEDLTVKGNVEWFASPLVTFKTGFEATRYVFSYLLNFTGKADSAIQENTREPGRINLTATDYVGSAYVQGHAFLIGPLAVQAGLRASYFDNRRLAVLDPRVMLRYTLSDHAALKASWGIYHQYFRLASMPDFSFFDTWLPTDSTVNPGRATQYALGVESRPFEGYDLNIEAYYKRLDHVSEMNMFVTKGRDVRDFFFDGHGEAFGFEIFVQRKTGRLTGWAGYALGYVNSHFDEINDGRWFRPRWDRRHDVKIVGQYRLAERWNAGATFTFQTGQSYTGMTSRIRSTMPGDNIGVHITMPAERYGLRLPPSHQLNINIDYRTTLFGHPFTVFLDVFNVYSRRDIWYRYYDATGETTVVRDVRLFPILPSLAVEMRF
ncbi:MAG: hypothetical protein QHI48_11670, partial [Bacteroidota bacterium]|nr:hypothetical protein [Bacteroidota bacterium]